MFEWILYIIIAVMAFKAGYWVHEKYFLWIMFHHPERLESALKMMDKVRDLDEHELANTDKSADEILADLSNAQELVIERQADLLYAYDKVTRAFIAQGASLEQVFEQASKRFPHKKFFGEIAQDKAAKELV
jgi:hypothetical protein